MRIDITTPQLELLENHFDLTELANTISDLHGCIGMAEWKDLDTVTQETCVKIHTILHHEEHWNEL